jgi:short-subunit dehydrogenase
MAPYDVGVSTLCPGFVVTNLRRTTAKLGGRLKLPDANTLPRSGVSAADVGDMVVQGIARNSAYIITHPDGWPGVEERMRAIEAAFASTSL